MKYSQLKQFCSREETNVGFILKKKNKKDNKPKLIFPLNIMYKKKSSLNHWHSHYGNQPLWQKMHVLSEAEQSPWNWRGTMSPQPECTYHLHHPVLPFICHIPPSSERSETLVCLLSLLCILHSLCLFISLLQAISDAPCGRGCEGKQAPRASSPQLPGTEVGWRCVCVCHHQTIGKTNLTKGNSQQMDLAIECVESFKSKTTGQLLHQ